MANISVYGTSFEELEDEERDPISKKPTPIQDQIAKDEHGKRRFHGAFTGGFSAGYWNTVGSKHGWVPQEFRSSRENRAEKQEQRAEDYMDDEDLGEFGIASRRVRQSKNFASELGLLGAGAGPGKRLAWEHDETKASSSSDPLAAHLEQMIKPVTDSIGVRLLKKMGWRQGQGIGPKVSRAILERMRAREGTIVGDAEDLAVAADQAPDFQFAPDDVLMQFFEHVEGTKGLGYRGLDPTSVLDEGYGKKVAAYKEKKKGRGIRGQAFGVGVFEEDDEDIYTNYDLSQYDFALDSVGGSDSSKQPTAANDGIFVPAEKSLRPRQFFAAPKLPPNFKPEHKPIPMDLKTLPEQIRQAGEKLNAVLRAQCLGEGRVNLKELIPDKDRKRLDRAQKGTRWGDEKKPEESKEKAPITQLRTRGWDVKEVKKEMPREVEAFPDEPLKQRRFKEYLQYLKRGLRWPKPTDMSTWEWEAETKDFEEKLSPEERANLPEVRARMRPLANTALAAPIADILRSKFTTEKQGDLALPQSKKDEDKMSAVKMGLFGAMTRESFNWHPHRDLSKRFNVPHPYPDSEIVGLPHLWKTNQAKAANHDQFLGLGLPNTMYELAGRKIYEEDEREARREEQKKPEEKPPPAPEEKPMEERPPMDFFDAIFGESSSDEEEQDKDKGKGKESDDDVNIFTGQLIPTQATTEEQTENGALIVEKGVEQSGGREYKLTSVIDVEKALEEERKEEEERKKKEAEEAKKKPELPVYSNILRHRERERKKAVKKERKKHKKHKKEKKSHHHHKSKKAKREKKHKKEKKRRREKSDESSSSSSDSSDDVIALN